MARARRTATSIFLFVAVLSLLLLLPASRGVDAGPGPCAQVPSMSAARACAAVCGTRHMRRLCLGTISSSPERISPGAAVPVTALATAAVRSALASYAATTAAAASLIDGGAVQDGGEKAAYGDCMVGYGRAGGAMARVADDLASGLCGGDDGVNNKQVTIEDLSADYTAGLRGMDVCSRVLLDYPATPLYAMNLADRNKTLLASLLCSLVVVPPPPQRKP